MSPWRAARIALLVLLPKACAQRSVESATLPLLVAIRTGPELRLRRDLPLDAANAEPSPAGAPLPQSAMIHVFDTTSLAGGPWYVNDHTLVQAPDGVWHLFGIFHHELVDGDAEVDFIHALSDEPDLATWQEGTFHAAPGELSIALTADRSLGETHLWAPHVVAAEGRWFMIYQGGGDGDHASIRLAESDDLYRWRRASNLPLFEDLCVARDPMLVRRGPLWSL